MKLFLKIIGFTLLLLLIVTLLSWTKLKRLYHVLHLFDSERIVENFRSFDETFDVSRLSPSTQPYEYPQKENIKLPYSFNYRDKEIEVSEFIDSSYTTGLIVIKNDTMVYEKYYRGNTPTQQNISWSMAKSFISALIGIAIDEGFINNIDEKVDRYAPELIGSGYAGVTIREVLTMSTGIKFNEDYGDFNSDINKWGRGFALGSSQDEFAASLQNEQEPGTYCHYVSINTHVLGMILRNATGRTITDYMQEKFWNPIGMQDDAYWIIDKKNMEVALGGLNATARDFGKIGSLYLNGGQWNGSQIVPSQWVKASTIPEAPHLEPSDSEFGYGYQWWLIGGDEGEYMAQGVYNQNIYINPTTRTVIVKLSANPHYTNGDVIYGRTSAHIGLYRIINDQLRENQPVDQILEEVN